MPGHAGTPFPPAPALHKNIMQVINNCLTTLDCVQKSRQRQRQMPTNTNMNTRMNGAQDVSRLGPRLEVCSFSLISQFPNDYYFHIIDRFFY